MTMLSPLRLSSTQVFWGAMCKVVVVAVVMMIVVMMMMMMLIMMVQMMCHVIYYQFKLRPSQFAMTARIP